MCCRGKNTRRAAGIGLRRTGRSVFTESPARETGKGTKGRFQEAVMNPKKELVIGLAGYGVVGTGFARALHEGRELIRRRTGRDIVIKTVAVKDKNEKFAYPLPEGATLTTSLDDLVNDPAIDVVIELIGGIQVARGLISKALSAGKHVVTANKALLAEDGKELFRIAGEKNLHLGYEASVCGGIPVVQAMSEGLAGNEILSLYGILNGTSNYILSEMSAKGMPFADALKDAQALGFAEADPTLDIEGFDAAHNLVLLIRLAWGVEYPFKNLPVQGISAVRPEDIEFARELGYSIKLIGQARMQDGRLSAGVFPALVHRKLLLSKVVGSYNAVWVKGNAVGSIFLHGRGAGDTPTGSAVLADILSIARDARPNNTGFLEQVPPLADVLDPEEGESSYYFRLMVEDKPGVLRDVAGAMAEYGISIAQAIQKGNDPDVVPLVFMTHEAKAKDVVKAVAHMRASHLLREEPVCYRVLHRG